MLFARQDCDEAPGIPTPHTQITNQVDRSTTNRNAASADIRHARHRRGQMSVAGNKDNNCYLLANNYCLQGGA